jgi:hypothetical protein
MNDQPGAGLNGFRYCLYLNDGNCPKYEAKT